MSRYVDGFVLVVPKNRIEDYAKMATDAGKIWKEYGALEFFENVGDDLEVKDVLTFTKLTNVGPDETVVFSWIMFESREHRDAVNAKVMADPRMEAMCDPKDPPFDFARMAYGGFKNLVHL